MRLLLLSVLVFFSVACSAADLGNLVACKSDLKNLIVPSIKRMAENKFEIYAELQEIDKGVFPVRLYASTGKEVGDNGSNRMTLGWVHLHVREKTAYDVTYDDESPDTQLKVDARAYQHYIDKCIDHVYREKEAADSIVTTTLPFRELALWDCTIADETANECVAHFHEYPINWLEPGLRKQIDRSAQTFFALPAILSATSNASVYLTTGPQQDVIYVFKEGSLVSKSVVGSSAKEKILTYDISKDYLVTVYEKAESFRGKVKKVTHQKLSDSGKFIVCPDANPACH